jgi:hypothetical protein
MAEYYFSAKIDTETTLCIAPISDKRVDLSGQEIEDRSGYFLYAVKGGGEPREVEILAQLKSDEAVLRLKQMLNLE